jgi:hypothetical protein
MPSTSIDESAGGDYRGTIEVRSSDRVPVWVVASSLG